jgi:hypothetical protein
LPTWVIALVVAGVLGASVLLPALLPPSERASWASWNWGTGAMTLLGLAVHVPPLRITALAAGHGALGVGVVLLGGGGLWEAQLALVSATTAPLGAAQYLHLYADAVRRRAAVLMACTEPAGGPGGGPPGAGSAGGPPGELAGARRLAMLRERIEPFLADVARRRAPLPLDAERSAVARCLTEQLREALAAQRRSLWLPEEVRGVPVSVIGSESATRAAGDAERAWLAALLDLVGRHDGWHLLRLVLALRPDGALTAVLTGAGPAASAAAADPLVRALCEGTAARCDADHELLVVEADPLTKIGA